MPVGGVVRHEVEDQADTAGVEPLDQTVEMIKRAEEWIDAGELGDMVAEIIGRGIDGTDPKRTDAEPLEIFETRQNAGQVALAIAVAVLERKRIELIDGLPLPPVQVRNR